MELFDPKDQVAIVTGGNGGIGLGMAKGMARAGATIVVAGRDAAKNTAAVKELEALGAKASAIPVDVLKEDSCRALIANTMKAYRFLGTVYIAIPSAADSSRERALTADATPCFSRGTDSMIISVGGAIASLGNDLTPISVVARTELREQPD